MELVRAQYNLHSFMLIGITVLSAYNRLNIRLVKNVLCIGFLVIFVMNCYIKIKVHNIMQFCYSKY